MIKRSPQVLSQPTANKSEKYPGPVDSALKSKAPDLSLSAQTGSSRHEGTSSRHETQVSAHETPV